MLICLKHTPDCSEKPAQQIDTKGGTEAEKRTKDGIQKNICAIKKRVFNEKLTD